jgi:hypothetical protein
MVAALIAFLVVLTTSLILAGLAMAGGILGMFALSLLVVTLLARA